MGACSGAGGGAGAQVNARGQELTPALVFMCFCGHSQDFVVTARILWHTLHHGLVCASSHVSVTCVHSRGGRCGTCWGVPVSDSHPCAPVPGHAVPVVHTDALPHPPKPEAAPAGQEGEQGGLHEEHTVSACVLLSPCPRVPPPTAGAAAPHGCCCSSMSPHIRFHVGPQCTPAPAVAFGCPGATDAHGTCHRPGEALGGVSVGPCA